MKRLQLVLTNPCLKQWDDLQPAANGRYCDSCEKHIVDLTDKSDAELINFFKRKKGNACGRVLSSQLGRELLLPLYKPNWYQLLPLAIGAVMVSPVQAKQLQPAKVQNAKPLDFQMASFETTLDAPLEVDRLTGSIKDESTGNPLKGVKVRQKGFENVLAISDSAGRFKLEMSAADSGVVFSFELNGYDAIESKLTDGMVIKLAPRRMIMLGAVCTVPLDLAPLYLVYSGKKSRTIDVAKLKEINPNWIEKLEVLKDAKATALYGSRAANGVILIEIKKAYAKKINFSKKD